MDGIRDWWFRAVASVGRWLSAAAERVAHGIMHEWNVGAAIFVFGSVVVLSALVIWRRKA